MKRIAVIGSGVSGLPLAAQLSEPGRGWRVTLFEAGSHFGGHAHTVDVTIDHVTHGVDTGFLVYNERTYPALVRLFRELRIETAPSDMSFSVQGPGFDGDGRLEWCGSDLNSVFAQRSNLVRPRFWRMLSDILRFNRLTTAIAERGSETQLAQPVGDFLDANGFSAEFRDGYLLPMIACIWSCPTGQMLAFPIATLIRFCHNHGLIQVTDRPQWHTVRGGSRQYVRRLVERVADARLNCPVLGVQRVPAGALVRTAAGTEHFDEVVFACHSDQALRLLGDDVTPAEREVLGAIRYHPNRAVLHTDVSLLPTRRRAWAAWNYERGAGPADGTPESGVCLHYLINRLQPLPWSQPVIVSLNPVREPAADHVLRRIDYEHPVFDLAAIAAQQRVPELQGQRHSWFCGAWTGYGFHEDGLRSGLAVFQALSEADPQRRTRGAA